ncbi:Bug family tripartite tricarboxylate transporter substrate binding protein [Rhodoferax sediminis]|uniref:Tripartite tricarboxylate transporter substrate binding protein n=1 Tax=Rhodoferax sediminis TaxID=2509614 RepID=A0A515DB78_9BURK|nr:tripartite tricarboxylate transporter substrate binding protein [Rhodoferax sediminis]QDL37671.1 tripartite tricarboxylate transporter substrate binding protein [Rhodoferax sediminis]
MRQSLKTLLRTGLGTLCIVLGAASAHAGDWPTRPITIIVPFAPGGTTDIVAREVGRKLSEALKQPVIIDNRGGAGGTVGAAIAAKAPPDGYTFFMATIAHAIAPGIYKHLPYDFQRDFDPVGLVATTPNVLIVNPQLPVKSVADLVAYIKANPGTVNFGSAGNGSTEHISGELFRSMTKTQITHIPYKGGAPMMVDVIGGQIQMAIETSPSANPHIHSGKVRALAVTTLTRSPAYPDVPTLNESGLPGYDMTTWFALMAPHGTPAAIVQRTSKELAQVLAQPDVTKRFEEQGVSAGHMSPAQLTAFVRSETAKWVKVVKESGATTE